MSQGTVHSLSKVGLAVLWHHARPLADFLSYQMKKRMNALMALVAAQLADVHNTSFEKLHSGCLREELF